MKLRSLTSVSLALALVVSLLAGCDKGGSEASKTPGGTESTKSADETKSPDTKATPSEADGTKEADKAADPSTIPDAIKGDAYELYGLNVTSPQKFEVTVNKNPPEEGEQTVTFKGMKDGVAQFSITRTGAFAASLGDQEMELSDKGLYVTSLTAGTLEEKALELPLHLKPGDSWHSKQKLTTPNATIETDAIYKVKGLEKVKTKAGVYDALLVVATGPIKTGGAEMQMTAKGWYAKGVGAVKSEIVSKSKKGETSRVLIELVK